jgi:hypothetical protein
MQLPPFLLLNYDADYLAALASQKASAQQALAFLLG